METKTKKEVVAEFFKKNKGKIIGVILGVTAAVAAAIVVTNKLQSKDDSEEPTIIHTGRYIWEDGGALILENTSEEKEPSKDSDPTVATARQAQPRHP